VFAGDDPHEVASFAITGAAVDFDRFYASTARRTLAVAYALTGSWADAEDLVQDAYADAHRRWDRVGTYDDPAAWVRRAVTNRSASRWRRLGREVRALTRVSARAARTTSEPEVQDAQFWSAVATLPGRQRAVVVLIYVDDLSIEQAATRLGCAEGTVKTHLSRARLALHALLDDERTGPQR
jgi:RNA polymerase sigma-70 factor (ECF subfamily)